VTHSDNRGWIAFDAPAATVESLLHTEYYEHHDSVTGGVLPACDKYHVPKSIQHHIDYVTPGIKLMAPMDVKSNTQHPRSARLKKRNPGFQKTNKLYRPEKPIQSNGSSDLSNCDVAITPACVAALYEIPRGKGFILKKS
jgi:tripeptidyl-peptidase I